MTIEVQTSQFQFAHGRMPRGTGGWFFEIVSVTDPKRESVWFEYNGSYTAAKKAAIAEAKRLGFAYPIIKVGS